jgi:hypothetical protein
MIIFPIKFVSLSIVIKKFFSRGDGFEGIEYDAIGLIDNCSQSLAFGCFLVARVH